MSRPNIKATTLKEFKHLALSQKDAAVFLNITHSTAIQALSLRKKGVLGMSLHFSDAFPADNEHTYLVKDKTAHVNICTLEDLDAYNDFLFCVSDYSNIYIVTNDPKDDDLVFVLYAGALIHYGATIQDSLYSATQVLPHSKPDALWPIMCLDKSLELNGALIEAYNDYFVTRTVVSSRGNIVEAKF